MPEEEVKKDGGEKLRTKVAMSELRMTKRNAHYSATTPSINPFAKSKSATFDSPLNLEEEVDMEITAILRPIKIVYRPEQFAKLTDFFALENINDEVKQRA